MLDTGHRLHAEGHHVFEAEVEAADKGARPMYIDAMKPYIIIVHKEPESAYGMTFPDAPGCFSAADEIGDLFAMATEAIEGWTEAMLEEGLPLPPTRDLADIKADPEWQESFADAVLVIAVESPQMRKAA